MRYSTPLSSRICLAAAWPGLAALALVSGPLAAQMTGSRLGDNANSKDAKAVLEVMVSCVGDRNPGYAGRVMRSLPGSEREAKTIFGNAGDLGMCMDDRQRRVVIGDNVEMRFNARTFRTALARVMAQRAARGLEAEQLAAAAPWTLSAYTLAADGDMADRMQVGLYQFGDCVVAARPVEALALLRSGTETPEGKAAIKALIPALGPCLNQGAQLTLDATALATAVAEPIYFRAEAVKAGKGSN